MVQQNQAALRSGPGLAGPKLVLADSKGLKDPDVKGSAFKDPGHGAGLETPNLSRDQQMAQPGFEEPGPGLPDYGFLGSGGLAKGLGVEKASVETRRSHLKTRPSDNKGQKKSARSFFGHRPLLDKDSHQTASPDQMDQIAAKKPPRSTLFKPLSLSNPSGANHANLADFAYPIGFVVCLVWTATVLSFAITYHSERWSFEFYPLQVSLLFMVIMLPAFVVFLTAYAFRQSLAIAQEAKKTRDFSEALVAPMVLALGQGGDLLKTMRGEIEQTVATTAAALEKFSEFQAVLRDDSQLMSENLGHVQEASRQLTDKWANERLEMGILSAELDSRATNVASLIQRQAKMVAEASDLAQAQIVEAEQLLAVRAADLAAAATDVGELGALAAQQVQFSTEQLGSLHLSMSDQFEKLQNSLSEEKAHFSQIMQSVKQDQEIILGQLEAERAQIVNVVAQARAGAQDVHGAANSSAESLRQLISEAATQFGGLSEFLRAEHVAIYQKAEAQIQDFTTLVLDTRHLIENDYESSIVRIKKMIEDMRQWTASESAALSSAILEESQALVDEFSRVAEKARDTSAHAFTEAETIIGHIDDIAQKKADKFQEIALEISQRTEAAFENKLLLAQKALEASISLLEKAGQASAKKIEQSLDPAHVAVRKLDGLIGELSARAAQLPAEAQANVEAVRASVVRGMEDLAHVLRTANHMAVKDILPPPAASARSDRTDVPTEIKPQDGKTAATAVKTADSVARAAIFSTHPKAPSEKSSAAVPAFTSPPIAPPQELSLASNAKPYDVSARNSDANSDARDLDDGDSDFEDVPLSFKGIDLQKKSDPTKPNLAVDVVFKSPKTQITRPEDSEPDHVSLKPANTAAPPLTTERPLTERALAERPLGREEWSFRELLKAIDDSDLDDAPTDGGFPENLEAEIIALVGDITKLFPESRILEIIDMLGAGSLQPSRDMVKRLAPAAIRRLSRRLQQDRALKIEALGFVNAFGSRLAEHLGKDPKSAVPILVSRLGRYFLFLDASMD